MNKAARAFLIAVVLLLPAPGAGRSQEPARRSPPPLSFQEYRLRNGLRVVLSEDARLPLVTVAVGYGAGTLRERPGQEGLAFLLENLMFQGSDNVGPLQHVAFVQKAGGELNATTAPDKALFYETLPSNQLALALWLESDRMKSLSIAPAAIQRTRADLLREHGERAASDPYLETFFLFDGLLFPDDLYGHPVIGPGMNDLSDDEVRAFYQTYYVPNNAVLCIVGNIDAARTRELVAKYFETIPPGQYVPPPRPPAFRRESDAVVRSARVPSGSAGFHMGFRFYPIQPGELDCVRLLEYILVQGPGSRLRDRLLRRDLIARYMTGGLDERLGAVTLKVFCLATNAVLVARSERAVLAEIDKLRSNPPSRDEMSRAFRRFKKDYLDRLSSNLGKARYFIDTAFANRDLGLLPGDLDRAEAVTPQAVSAFVSRYFTPQNRVVLEFWPQ